VQADPAAAQASIDAAIEQLNAVIRDVRSYIFELRPAKLTDDLRQSLIDMVEHFRVNSLIDVTCDVESPLPAIGSEQRASLFHIAQEALVNARRHARATAVRVELGRLGGELRLRVQDNGAGFDTGAPLPEAHNGLRNMAARARAAGGTLNVESTPGSGTVVEVTVPVPPGDESL
jgi:signal transduction histidine kinase